MIDKTVLNLEAAINNIKDVDTLMIGGFGNAGQPTELIKTLIEHGTTNLAIISATMQIMAITV